MKVGEIVGKKKAGLKASKKFRSNGTGWCSMGRFDLDSTESRLLFQSLG